MKKKPDKTEVYFPGLHGLRFLAAWMVVFSHVELLKDYHGYPNLYASNLAVYECGRIGVTLFFVLSGFLISYLLLTERKVSGTISIKNSISGASCGSGPCITCLCSRFYRNSRIEFFTIPEFWAAPELPLRYALLAAFAAGALSIFEPFRMPSHCGRLGSRSMTAVAGIARLLQNSGLTIVVAVATFFAGSLLSVCRRKSRLAELEY
jgi:peptidoglycan/LPS O-acetylase OafA/YrhL